MVGEWMYFLSFYELWCMVDNRLQNFQMNCMASKSLGFLTSIIASFPHEKSLPFKL